MSLWFHESGAWQRRNAVGNLSEQFIENLLQVWVLSASAPSYLVLSVVVLEVIGTSGRPGIVNRFLTTVQEKYTFLL